MLLSSLLIVIGIRLLKSTLFIYEESLPVWIINGGFAAHAAAAVLLWIYITSNKADFHWRSQYLLHLLPAGLILLFSNQITLDNFWYRGGYTGLLYYSIAYLGLAAREWVSFRKEKKSRSTWPTMILTSTTLFLLSYLGNYILRWYDYSYAPLPFAITIFPVSFFLWQRRNDNIRKKNTVKRLSDEETSTLAKDWDHVMQAEAPYLNPDLTLGDMAEKLQVSRHILSHFLNSSKAGFSKTINAYRVGAACTMLVDSKCSTYKIATIAYSCGFNSLSVFNKAFVEVTGLTPAEYRKRSD